MMRPDGCEIGTPLLSVRQVASFLGMSTDFIYTTVKNHVPYLKIGGALRFRKEDIDRYIASRVVAPLNTRDIKSPIDLREIMDKSREKSLR